MAKKVTNFSDLIQRVTASCLLHPLGNNRVEMTPDRIFPSSNTSHQLKAKLSNPEDNSTSSSSSEEEEEEEEDESGEIYEDARETEEELLQSKRYNNGLLWAKQERENEVWVIMDQVFHSISAMKKAYGKLQEAHSPWDPEKMRVADAAVVAELRRLGVLRERFRRGRDRKRDDNVVAARAAETVIEVVAPYEAAVEELKKEVKAKEVELEDLKQKVNIFKC